MTTPPSPRVRLRARKSTRGFPSSESVAQLELWALLCNTDCRKIAAATSTLDRETRKGLRHFSALKRAVPLQSTQEAEREIHEMERTAGLDEVFERQSQPVPDPNKVTGSKASCDV